MAEAAAHMYIGGTAPLSVFRELFDLIANEGNMLNEIYIEGGLVYLFGEEIESGELKQIQDLCKTYGLPFSAGWDRANDFSPGKRVFDGKNELAFTTDEDGNRLLSAANQRHFSNYLDLIEAEVDLAVKFLAQAEQSDNPLIVEHLRILQAGGAPEPLKMAKEFVEESTNEHFEWVVPMMIEDSTDPLGSHHSKLQQLLDEALVGIS